MTILYLLINDLKYIKSKINSRNYGNKFFITIKCKVILHCFKITYLKYIKGKNAKITLSDESRKNVGR